MKSQLGVLLHVTRGLCEDVQASYPALKGLDSDFGRLSLYCQTRGLSLFTMDLPHLDTLLCAGLETGRLSLEGPLSKRVSKRIQVPRLFSGLWLRVFDGDACLKHEVDVTAVAFLRQLFRLGKNIEVECSFDRVQATVGEYHDIERQLRAPTHRWDLDDVYFGKDWDSYHLSDCCFQTSSRNQGSLFSSQKEEEERFRQDWLNRSLLDRVQQVADLIMSEFQLYDPVALSEQWESEGLGTGFKHGPGAVSEKLKNWEKSEFPSWPDKLQRFFPFELVGKTAGSDKERPSRHEVAGRLICVPKTAKSPRLIASEPVAHMYVQQHIWRFCREELSRIFGTDFIDFSKQSRSADLVLSASLTRDLATVDLSSASDRLSCWTVERLFRRNPTLLTALHAARTRYLRDDVSKVQNFLPLKKFASQGSATNFPIQSICYLIIAIGACIDGRVTWQKIRNLRHQVRVYGDDIIIPKTGYVRLVAVMESLQLKVNKAKSYVNGHFRESCGTDGFMGCCVTPVSPKTLAGDSPASRRSVVDTTNNLFLKGYWHASDRLRDTLPPHLQRGLRIVATGDAGFAGLSSFSGSDESHLIKRWNSRLHRYEVRAWSLSDRAHKRERQGYSALLDFMSRKHDPRNSRVVSEYGETRKTRDGLLWEPLNSDARVHASERGTPLPDGGRTFPQGLVRHPRGWCPKLAAHIRK